MGAELLPCREAEDSDEESDGVENFVDVVSDDGGGVGTNDEKLTDILDGCP